MWDNPTSEYYGPRIFSPYPVMPSQLKTTEKKDQEEVTPNPLLDRAIYQGRGHWECNELELLINKAEFSIPEITNLPLKNDHNHRPCLHVNIWPDLCPGVLNSSTRRGPGSG